MGKAVSSAGVIPTRADSEGRSPPAISAAGGIKSVSPGGVLGDYCSVHSVSSGFAIVSPKQIVLDKDHCFLPGYPFVFPVEEFTFREVCSHAIQHKPSLFFFNPI